MKATKKDTEEVLAEVEEAEDPEKVLEKKLQKLRDEQAAREAIIKENMTKQ